MLGNFGLWTIVGLQEEGGERLSRGFPLFLVFSTILSGVFQDFFMVVAKIPRMRFFRRMSSMEDDSYR